MVVVVVLARSAVRLEVAQQELQAKQMEGELGTQTEEQAELEAAIESEGMGALFRMGKLETENTMRKVRLPLHPFTIAVCFIDGG